ncbi:NAD-P-binding protein [Fimicolochytrium jonesii]|uniref:NAD-P-binding protein n=1 Tax=Fimicolochytrium jonesii TaxID=1396493 RepID=UPI0022FE8ACF|nr:NAD-P-binding protein [Fimicolochytrium jonesii]KAI8822374.1 NAD-P-binding protein [Fimicolochytrium jonesii]
MTTVSTPTATLGQPLAGKVALITGGSRGIGRAIALRLANDGASVIVNYVSNDATAKAVVDEINALPATKDAKDGKPRAIAVKADVASVDQAKKLADRALEVYGKLDVLVLNAGILPNESLLQITDASFDRAFAVNVKGPLFLTQSLAPKMSPNGRVIFFSSTLTAASVVTPNYLLYNATKGAVEQLARVLAKELSKSYGLTVNTVSPGPTATEMFFEGKSEQTLNFIKGLSPFNRFGEPNEIAAAVAFFAGPDSSWVNGHNLRVNGGYVV